jgi:hypothetical protein
MWPPVKLTNLRKIDILMERSSLKEGNCAQFVTEEKELADSQPACSQRAEAGAAEIQGA